MSSFDSDMINFFWVKGNYLTSAAKVILNADVKYRPSTEVVPELYGIFGCVLRLVRKIIHIVEPFLNRSSSDAAFFL